MNAAAAAGPAPGAPRLLRPYLRALWPQQPPRLAMLPPQGRRAVLAAGTLYLPRGGPDEGEPHSPSDAAAADAGAAVPGVMARAATDRRRLHLAGAAHAGAHLAYGGPRFERGSLAQVQLALLGVLEDARVEWLAARELPGLPALWLPFHRAGPDAGSDFETLLARLARVLADPGRHDPHPWVEKGRRLFYADAEGRRLALADAASLRRAASLLGNDIGQMRLRFNPGLYLVQPGYRDDNSHLWAFDERLPPSSLTLEAPQEASARPASGPQGESVQAPAQPRIGAELPQPAEASAAMPQAEAGACLARYPEWDRLIGRHRPAWVRIVEPPPRPAAAAAVARLREELGREAALLRRLRRRLSEHAASQPRGRPRRAPEGETFHLGALVDAGVAQRMRTAPDPRIYLRPQSTAEAVAVLILLDASASTARPAGTSGRSVLEAARVAALACAGALESAGHACAIQAFASDGRHAVQVGCLKDFGERSDDDAVLARSAALASALSTRVGAALRHAGAVLARRREARRLVLLLTDGEPHDIDVHDSRYLLDDLRAAAAETRRRGIGVACLDLDGSAAAARREALRRVFAPGACRALPRLDTLPQALAAVLAGAWA